MRPASPALVASLERALGRTKVLARPLDRLGRSADASIYRLVPEVVVRPGGVDDVRAILACAGQHGRHLTFRAAGTSLSGQASTDGILVELAQGFRGLRVLDEGRRVWAEPGVVGGHLNRLLASVGRRIGPDPASIDAAMVGGIVANNASGMCCGTAENSYATLDSLSLLLADGTFVDTGEPEADASLRAKRPDLHGALSDLRDEIRRHTELPGLIRRRFALKNTTAYSLQAFLDRDAPADILARLMVGSQGTLGFLSGVTLRTVREPPARATALVYFPQLAEAGSAVAPLVSAGAAALEIMDASSLRSQAEDRADGLEVTPATAALLVELREEDEDALDKAVGRARDALGGFRLLSPAAFTRDPAERERHWRLRKGLFPSVGALRAPGTSVVIEDVAVPVPRLAEAIHDLHGLFHRHGFDDAIVFGHAKDGNLHFVFARDFSDSETVSRYAAFMAGLAALVVRKYDGSLKAEHGSGRNMAPFVRDEWGEAGTAVLKRVKALLDPQGLLNPDVVLSPDPEIHLKALKDLPRVSGLVDTCIECGFCEPRCPSRDLTLTPRQRIVAAREIARLTAASSPEAAALRRSLQADFAYEGVATCAGDAMCQTSCPVKIDTGALIKEMKAARQPALALRLADLAAGRFGLVSALARAALRAVSAARRVPGGPSLVHGVSFVLHLVAPTLIPVVPPELTLPARAPRLPSPRARGGRPSVVYFPSCLTRILGPLPGETAPPLAEALLDLLEAAGFEARYPAGLPALCCGMPFLSKGFPAAAAPLASKTAEALWSASREGRDPVVTDASPCAATLVEQAAAHLRQSGRVVRLMDFPSFWASEALPRLGVPRRRPGTAVVHPACALVRSGGLDDLLAVARAHAARVVVPATAECCGFAGDRGFLLPELTASALAVEAAEINALGAEIAVFSTVRTCEIGLGRATGRECRSLVHLIHEALHHG